jgi:hypothetical protein
MAPFYHPIWTDQRNEILDGDFSNYIIPFFVDSHVRNYDVSISVTRSAEGNVMKVILLLIKEVNDQVPQLAMG